MEQDKVNRLSEVGRNVWDEDADKNKTTTQDKKKVSFGQRWAEARPTKTTAFWAWLGSIVLTMIIGFTWGGWVTGGTAETMATKMANDAVVQRLAPICVVQFNQDAEKDQKLTEFQEISSYQRAAFVEKQGWATMVDEEKPDRKVADACAKLLLLIGQ